MNEARNWSCRRCNCALEKKKTVFHYLGRTFTHEVMVCPKCGRSASHANWPRAKWPRWRRSWRTNNASEETALCYAAGTRLRACRQHPFRSVAPPFRIEPAALGFDAGYAPLRRRFWKKLHSATLAAPALTRLRPASALLCCSSFPHRTRFAGLRCGVMRRCGVVGRNSIPLRWPHPRLRVCVQHPLHSVLPPFRIEPALLGFDAGFAPLRRRFWKKLHSATLAAPALTRLRPASAPFRSSSSPHRTRFAGLRCGACAAAAALLEETMLCCAGGARLRRVPAASARASSQTPLHCARLPASIRSAPLLLLSEQNPLRWVFIRGCAAAGACNKGFGRLLKKAAGGRGSVPRRAPQGAKSPVTIRRRKGRRLFCKRLSILPLAPLCKGNWRPQAG